jgi:hypothetical protein
MALTDEVQSRYSTQLLINASNPQSAAATTIDTTRLNNAVTDVQAAFKKRGITYDNTIDTHVATAVPGVYARLLVVTGQDGGREEWTAFLDDLKLLAETTSRDRVVPYTDSLLSPTQDTSGDLPMFDRKQFEGYVPGAPTSPTTLD